MPCQRPGGDRNLLLRTRMEMIAVDEMLYIHGRSHSCALGTVAGWVCRRIVQLANLRVGSADGFGNSPNLRVKNTVFSLIVKTVLSDPTLLRVTFSGVLSNCNLLRITFPGVMPFGIMLRVVCCRSVRYHHAGSFVARLFRHGGVVARPVLLRTTLSHTNPATTTAQQFPRH